MMVIANGHGGYGLPILLGAGCRNGHGNCWGPTKVHHLGSLEPHVSISGPLALPLKMSKFTSLNKHLHKMPGECAWKSVFVQVCTHWRYLQMAF